MSSCLYVRPIAGRDMQLFLDDIDAGDHFGDRVLHLHAGIHFDEIELAVLGTGIRKYRHRGT